MLQLACEIVKTNFHVAFCDTTLDNWTNKPILEHLTNRWVKHFLQKEGIYKRSRTWKLLIFLAMQETTGRSVTYYLGQLKRGIDSGKLVYEFVINVDETHLVVNLHDTASWRLEKKHMWSLWIFWVKIEAWPCWSPWKENNKQNFLLEFWYSRTIIPVIHARNWVMMGRLWLIKAAQKDWKTVIDLKNSSNLYVYIQVFRLFETKCVSFSGTNSVPKNALLNLTVNCKEWKLDVDVCRCLQPSWLNHYILLWWIESEASGRRPRIKKLFNYLTPNAMLILSLYQVRSLMRGGVSSKACLRHFTYVFHKAW